MRKGLWRRPITEEGEPENVSTRRENARAIRLCLDYLANEARGCGLDEVARLIDVAALAAQDVTDVVH